MGYIRTLSYTAYNIIIEQKVLLDFELAEIYRYETMACHQQVEMNIEKFDKDFMFRLIDE